MKFNFCFALIRLKVFWTKITVNIIVFFVDVSVANFPNKWTFTGEQFFFGSGFEDLKPGAKYFIYGSCEPWAEELCWIEMHIIKKEIIFFIIAVTKIIMLFYWNKRQYTLCSNFFTF